MDTPFPNQPQPYRDRNLFVEDFALQGAMAAEGAGAFMAELREYGAQLGSAETLALGDAANRHPPELATHDARGERLDEVSFHPAWDALMEIARAAGEHCSPWSTPRAGAHVARAARAFMHAQVENGTQCPITMTFAAIPVLRRHGADIPQFSELWLPRLFAREHDARTAPVAFKRAALIGMGMTERQGGSDVRSNRTRACASSDGSYRLTGHKWFFSVPQSDAHLVLARESDGISCFFLPRFAPGGERNHIRINRLKDKLGNRSNASSEVEFDDAYACRVGAPAQGIATILEMVRYTRLDCVLGSAGIMRAVLARALHHAQHRVVFGHHLIDQPLMRNVLADLAVEVEAATSLGMRLARAFEAGEGTREHAFARLVTPAAKFWVCKRGPTLAAEAMEVLGGNGYTEESGLPRLYRELPVNSIWEGSGNVMALDVIRTMQREPETLEALQDEFDLARGGHRDFDAALSRFERERGHATEPARARRTAQEIATLVSASLLLRHAPGPVADAFCVSRLGMSAFGGAVPGTLENSAVHSDIVSRATGA
ncbi:MAG: isovaleryl-CoA dehydrogenase [Pseudomonadota bacterium]|nr:isovaleryl-CoA dehydrogenase [Pseudomonadota bacterium]